MGYTVLDIINKIITIKLKVKSIYSNIESEKNIDISFKCVVSALLQEQQKHIDYYKKLEKQLKGQELEDIDFVIYDKISSLIIEYNNKVNLLNISPKYITELLSLALDFQNQNSALMIDIQGRLVRKSNDVDSKNYNILTNVLEHEKKYMKILNNLLKI